jgi:hypothetical protein
MHSSRGIRGIGITFILVTSAAAPVAVGAAAAHLSPSAAPARVIDRTVLCETALRAGVRNLDARVIGALREGANAHGGAIELFSPWSPDAYLAGLTEGSLTLNHKRCRPVKTRVRLYGRGLDGGPLGPFGETYDCTPPRFVLLRLRAAFRAKVSLRVTPWDDQVPFPVMRARGRVREGYIAVQTRAQKPLLFGSVSDTRNTRLLTAPTCIPE